MSDFTKGWVVSSAIVGAVIGAAGNGFLSDIYGRKKVIIATALIDTGSRMDEVIFEEFKGTGNSEIILDRKLTDKRLFPTIDITRSGTRKEELLVDKATLSKMWVLRRVLMQMGMTDGMEFLLDKLRLSKDNQDFFNTMNS